MNRIQLTAPLVLLLVAGCSAPVIAPPAAPSYLTSETGCAIVVGGAVGDYFGEKEIDDFWSSNNSRIASQLLSNLKAAGYRVNGLVIATPERNLIVDRTSEAIASTQCNLLVQLSHTIDQDTQGNFFQFNVAILRAEPKSSRDGALKVTMEQVYRKDYRYRRTSAVLRSFRIEDFAEVIETDMRTSGILARLRRTD